MIDLSAVKSISIPEGKVLQISVKDAVIWNKIKRYGFKREKSNSDPYARITYIYDAEGMTPMSVNLSTNTPDYGDWKEFIDEVCRPVMLKYDGTVDYELSHDDQNYKLDGSASDITSDAYNGNAMIEFRKYKWVKRYEDMKYEYVIFCEIQLDDEYKPYAFVNELGKVSDVFYWGMFESILISSRLRSLGNGQALDVNRSTDSQITYAQANGAGWNIGYKSGWDYICDLLTLLGKSDNSQATFGYGCCKTSNTATLKVGTIRTGGAFWGSSNQTSGVKTLYIENFWGNIWERINGMILDKANGIKVKMTPPYNLTGDEFTYTGVKPSMACDGYWTQSICGDLGYIPLSASGGSATTYMCDGHKINITIVGVAAIGGRYNYGLYTGSRCISLASGTAATSTVGCRLTYIPV